MEACPVENSCRKRSLAAPSLDRTDFHPARLRRVGQPAPIATKSLYFVIRGCHAPGASVFQKGSSVGKSQAVAR